VVICAGGTDLAGATVEEIANPGCPGLAPAPACSCRQCQAVPLVPQVSRLRVRARSKEHHGASAVRRRNFYDPEGVNVTYRHARSTFSHNHSEGWRAVNAVTGRPDVAEATQGTQGDLSLLRGR